jgi:hypothetical protein
MIEYLPFATFDYICHPICPSCGKLPLDPTDIHLQTKLGGTKSSANLEFDTGLGRTEITSDFMKDMTTPD